MIGTKVAHYEITAHLGSGGMGEVYLERLAETVRSGRQKLPDEIVKAVSANLADFIGRVRPFDDRTMIVVKMGEQ
jgi:hypothetical protein